MSKSPQPPRRVDPVFLEKSALFYLERFSASSASLKTTLMRKVRLAAAFWGEDELEKGEEIVAQLIEKLTKAGYLDDQRYAWSKARYLRQRGMALKNIARTLAAKGVGTQIIDDALVDLTAEVEEAGGETVDLQSARQLARRRRLGPWRNAAKRADYRQRDLASLGRAGFSWEIAREIIDGEKEPE